MANNVWSEERRLAVGDAIEKGDLEKFKQYWGELKCHEDAFSMLMLHTVVSANIDVVKFLLDDGVDEEHFATVATVMVNKLGRAVKDGDKHRVEKYKEMFEILKGVKNQEDPGVKWALKMYAESNF